MREPFLFRALLFRERSKVEGDEVNETVELNPLQVSIEESGW